MPSLSEHLTSPQFPDDEPITEDDLARPGMNLARFTGGWVAAGRPRWKAYAIHVTSIIGGVLLALPAGVEDSIFTIVGFAFIAFGVFGAIETVIGKRLWRP